MPKKQKVQLNLAHKLFRAEIVAVASLIILTMLATVFSIRQSNIAPSLSLRTSEGETLGLKISDHNQEGRPLSNSLTAEDPPYYHDHQIVSLRREGNGDLVERSRIQGELEFRDTSQNLFNWEGVKTIWQGIDEFSHPTWENSGGGLLGGYGGAGGWVNQVMTVGEGKLFIISAAGRSPDGWDGPDCCRDEKFGTTILSYTPDNILSYGWTLDRRDGLFSDREQVCPGCGNNVGGPRESKTSGSNNLIFYEGKLIALVHHTKNCLESSCGIKSKYVYANDSTDAYGKRSVWRLVQPADFGGDNGAAKPMNKSSLIVHNNWLYLLGENWLYRADRSLNWQKVSVIDPTNFLETNWRFTDTMISFKNELIVAHFRNSTAPSGHRDSKTEIKILKNNQLESVFLTEANYQPVHFFIHKDKLFLILKGLPIRSAKDKLIYSTDGLSWSEVANLPFGEVGNKISTAISYTDSVTNQPAIYLATSGETGLTGEIFAPTAIWRSVDESNWIKTGPRDICTGDRYCWNFDISDFEIYRGELYALTRNQINEAAMFNGQRYQLRGSQLYKLNVNPPINQDKKAALEIKLPNKLLYLPKQIRIKNYVYSISYTSQGSAVVRGGGGDSPYLLEVDFNSGLNHDSDLDDYYIVKIGNISKGDIIHDFKIVFDAEAVRKERLLNLERYLENNQVNNTFLGGPNCETGSNFAKTKICLDIEAVISTGVSSNSVRMRQSINRLGEILVEGNVAAGVKIEGLTLFNDAIFVGGEIENVSGGNQRLSNYVRNSSLDWSKVGGELDKLFSRREIAPINNLTDNSYSGLWHLNSQSGNPKNQQKDSFSTPPEGKIWRLKSESGDFTFNAVDFKGKGTLFFEENHRIIFTGRLSCQSGTSLAIINKGDIVFEGNLSSIDCGAFITTGGSIIFRKPAASVTHRGIFISANNINFPQPASLNGPMVIFFDSYLADNPPVFLQELLKIIGLQGR